MSCVCAGNWVLGTDQLQASGTTSQSQITTDFTIDNSFGADFGEFLPGNILWGLPLAVVATVLLWIPQYLY